VHFEEFLAGEVVHGRGYGILGGGGKAGLSADDEFESVRG
jgi:hypothetical protein